MKSYCDLNQCKVLMEFLPLESADMFYTPANVVIDDVVKYCEPILHKPIWNPEEAIPCWSSSALLEIIHDTGRYELQMYEYGYYFVAKDFITESYSNVVDACYEMILKLHERKLL